MTDMESSFITDLLQVCANWVIPKLGLRVHTACFVAL